MEKLKGLVKLIKQQNLPEEDTQEFLNKYQGLQCKVKVIAEQSKIFTSFVDAMTPTLERVPQVDISSVKEKQLKFKAARPYWYLSDEPSYDEFKNKVSAFHVIGHLCDHYFKQYCQLYEYVNSLQGESDLIGRVQKQSKGTKKTPK